MGSSGGGRRRDDNCVGCCGTTCTAVESLITSGCRIGCGRCRIAIVTGEIELLLPLLIVLVALATFLLGQLGGKQKCLANRNDELRISIDRHCRNCNHG